MTAIEEKAILAIRAAALARQVADLVQQLSNLETDAASAAMFDASRDLTDASARQRWDASIAFVGAVKSAQESAATTAQRLSTLAQIYQP